MKRKLQIGVIGESVTGEKNGRVAYEVGRGIAGIGARLVCGGLGGVMEHACRGAKDAGGETVGIIMGYDRNQANHYVDIAIATGMHHARNVLVVTSSDAIIAIGGSFGTLSEMSFSLKFKIPLIVINGWELKNPRETFSTLYPVSSAPAAIKKLKSVLSI